MKKRKIIIPDVINLISMASLDEPTQQYYRQFKTLSVDQKIYHTTAVIVSVTVVGCALVYLKFVLVPLTLAFFLSYFFAPVVDLLAARGPWTCCSIGCSKLQDSQLRAFTVKLKPLFEFLFVFKFPKWVAVLMSFLFAFVLMIATATVMVYSVDDFLDNSEKYSTRLSEVSVTLYSALMKFGFGSTHKDTIIAYIANLPLGTLISEVFNACLRFCTDTLLVMIIVVYLLLGRESRSGIWQQIDQQIRHYIVLKVLISAAFGLLVAVILLLLRVDLAIVFGLMGFILNFIPTVGSVIAILLPLPVLLLDPEKSWLIVFLAIVLPAAASFIFGWIVEPSIFGSSMQLNEIAVLLALVFWGALWGIAGAILTVPILVVTKIVLEQMEHPIAHNMLCLITGQQPKKARMSDVGFSGVDGRSSNPMMPITPSLHNTLPSAPFGNVSYYHRLDRSADLSIDSCESKN